MRTKWRPEPVIGEMIWDDLRLEVICQSNLEIAGSPRDIFRYSLLWLCCGVELLENVGGSNAICIYQTPNTQQLAGESDSPV